MKKLIVLFLIMSSSVFAQDITDALRFSSNSINGTARYTAMGGAFGALGGDISAIQINPASSAIFLNNKFSASLDLSTIDNDSFYGGGFTTSSSSDFDLNQLGAVFVFTTTNENTLFKKLTLGFSYNRTNNFNDEYSVSGSNNESVAGYFLNNAQGVPLDLLTPRDGESPADLYRFLGENQDFGAQQAFLGYETFIIDALNSADLDNTQYVSNVTGSDFRQTYFQESRGNSGKYTLNGGGMIGDRIHLGLNLNYHFLDYRRLTLFDEFNSGSGVTDIFFDNDLSTRGSGFSFQLGSIAKITDAWRVGFTYDSPTWMSISDELLQTIETVRSGGDVSILDPRVLNIYPEYSFKTPGRLSLSTAYVFGGSGLISFDYSYKDYSAMEFTSSGFETQNQDISNLMTSASTFNLGGEYKINNVSLRAGYFFQESPYENESFLGDTEGSSFGLGYNFGNATLDFSYQRVIQDRQGVLYFTGLTQESEIQSIFNNYRLTLAFNL
ncbi:OmpP1/FadL family transporter [Psychroflexus sediminis]|uniref:Outer membrane protein transport protein (OMPP1/FadL/TodX) n=1 Tax=Psychroflexus sediminis TaxID=470826 RepID=A0A1G7YAD0_9FLAO|nr:outer membrane protein transport protein [Psychroflexus sediminis]SDG93289.1 Outer membrane protein transport protein (OMPP1/FadL/TodX) [Psychroflexus sediminis]